MTILTQTKMIFDAAASLRQLADLIDEGAVEAFALSWQVDDECLTGSIAVHEDLIPPATTAEELIGELTGVEIDRVIDVPVNSDEDVDETCTYAASGLCECAVCQKN